MAKTYFDPADLKNFGKITAFQEPYGKKFFDYYNNVMTDGALKGKTKALIALSIAHSQQCPYCIDAYTQACIEAGYDEEEMMEAVHVAAAMSAGIKLVHSVQMMNKSKELLM